MTVINGCCGITIGWVKGTFHEYKGSPVFVTLPTSTNCHTHTHTQNRNINKTNDTRVGKQTRRKIYSILLVDGNNYCWPARERLDACTSEADEEVPES